MPQPPIDLITTPITFDHELQVVKVYAAFDSGVATKPLEGVFLSPSQADIFAKSNYKDRGRVYSGEAIKMPDGQVFVLHPDFGSRPVCIEKNMAANDEVIRRSALKKLTAEDKRVLGITEPKVKGQYTHDPSDPYDDNK